VIFGKFTGILHSYVENNPDLEGMKIVYFPASVALAYLLYFYLFFGFKLQSAYCGKSGKPMRILIYTRNLRGKFAGTLRGR
jgi:hypothetical protein